LASRPSLRPLPLPLRWLVGGGTDRAGERPARPRLHRHRRDCAQWLVLARRATRLARLCAAFLLFRIFDIAKPWPARLVERRVAGGLGIMLDDIVRRSTLSHCC